MQVKIFALLLSMEVKTVKKRVLGVIESLLDDGVLILSQDVDNLDTLLTNYPDLITDIIKVHEFLRDKECVISEFIYPQGDEVVYGIIISQEVFMPLLVSLTALKLRSENLIIEITPPTRVEDD